MCSRMKACQKCSYKTQVNYSLDFHTMRKHLMRYNAEPFYGTNEPEEYKCVQCSSSFDYRLSLMKHVRCIHNPTEAEGNADLNDLGWSSFDDFDTFKCTKCNTVTCSIASHLQHFNSSKCPFTIVSIDGFEAVHQQVDVKEDLFQCEHCLFVTRSKLQFKSHILFKHTAGEYIKWFNCGHCSFKSKTKGLLKWHILNIHTNKEDMGWFNCEHCSLKFKIKQYLNDHMLLKHTAIEDIKMFCCTQCSYKSKFKCNLSKHNLTKHIGKADMKLLQVGDHNSFKCPTTVPLNDEFEVPHQHVGQKRNLFHCEQCIFVTKSKSQLKSHILFKHTAMENIKWFHCGYCPFKSKTKNHLKPHISDKHTAKEDIKWFQCGHCTFKSKRKNNLEEHILNRHTAKGGKTWYHCVLGPRMFNTERNLKNHILCKHPTI